MRFLFLLLLLNSGSLLADSPKQLDSSRSISDLMYLPNEDIVFIKYNQTQNVQKVNLNFQGTSFTSDKITEQLGTFEIGKSISQDSSVSFSLPRTIFNQTVTEFGDASNRSGEKEYADSSGPGDWAINSRLRITKQSNDSFNIDIVASFSPGSGERELASEARDGNGYRGGALYLIRSEIGKKYQDFEYLYGLQISSIGASDAKNLSDNSSIETDSYNTYEFIGTIQSNSKNNFILSAQARYIIFEDIYLVSGGSKGKYTFENDLSFSFSGGYKFNEVFLGKITYSSSSINGSLTISDTELDYTVQNDVLAFDAIFQF